MKGAKKEGAVGFVKGVGQGIFSVPFRVMGGAFSVPGYAMKGIYQEMIKSKGKTVQNYIIAARIAQGYDAANDLSRRERDDIIAAWKYAKVGIKKKKNLGEDQMDSLHLLVQEKRKRRQERWSRVNSHFKKPDAQTPVPSGASGQATGSQYNAPLTHSVSHGSTVSSPGPRTLPPGEQPAWRQQHAATFPRPTSSQAQESNASLEAQLIAEEEAEQRELEAAIAASIHQNSSGNAQEDELVANAIRASIAELDRQPADVGAEEEEQALKRAMTASLEEAGRTGSSAEEQRVLEETIRRSLLDTSKRRLHGSDSEWESSDTEGDEEFQRIVAESKEVAHLHEKYPEEYKAVSGAQEAGIMRDIADATGASASDPTQAGASVPSQPPTLPSRTADGRSHAEHAQDADEEEELRKALKLSEQSHQEDAKKLEQAKNEEDIVMEYVRKQSLLEDEHRRKIGEGSASRASGQ